MVNSKFFEGTQDLVAASMQALRVLRKYRGADIESRMVHENLLNALCKIGVKHALRQLEQEEKKDAA